MNFTAMDITLRTLTENDLPFVKDIYDYYTLHTTVVYFVPVSYTHLTLPTNSLV